MASEYTPLSGSGPRKRYTIAYVVAALGAVALVATFLDSNTQMEKGVTTSQANEVLAKEISVEGMEFSITNLAKGRPTSQSSTAHGGSSGRAVDGKTSSSWYSYSCTHTNTQANPWWKVDLGKTYQISNVKLYNRSDCCASRLQKVRVATSQNGSTWANCGYHGGIVGSSATIACSAQARWVRITLEYTGILTLCEVEVNGGEVSSGGAFNDKSNVVTKLLNKVTTLSADLHWTASYGGNGGTWFGSQSCFPWGIKRVRIWGGAWLDKVQFQCRNGDWKQPSGGRLAGSVKEFEVLSDEYIDTVVLRSGSKVDRLELKVHGFLTSKSRFLGGHGGHGGNRHELRGSGEQKELYAFRGRAGDVMDQLAFGFAVKKAMCAVAEDIAGRNCDNLWHDTSAKSAGTCNANCCSDSSCGLWTFTSDNKCLREKGEANQSNSCGFDGKNIVAGYRLARDSAVGAQIEGAFSPGVGPATNVAKNKPASQSSTGYGGVASRAVDGNTNRSWSGNSCTHTNTQTNPWWKVDLKQTYSISSVKLYNRSDCCGDRLQRVRVKTSTNGSSWVNCGYHGAQVGATATIACAASARWVMIQVERTGPLTLCEVEVMAGGASPPPKLPLPQGSPPSTAWPACWIDSYGRGVGEPLSTCPHTAEKNGLLCYPKCKSGYYGVGPVCWERCPSGWNDGGVFCNIWMHTIGAEKDCPWYDVCGLTFAKGCTKCPSRYANHGCLCTKPPKHMTKGSYGRTAGKPMICRQGLDLNGALCYDKCAAGYKGVGPVCWGQCPSSHPHKCGPLMCTKNSAECSGKIGNIAKNIFLKGGIAGIAGIVDELCIPKCGDQRHMACTIVGQVADAVSVCPLDITKCPQAFKCLSFLGKRAEVFAKGVSNLLSGGALKDFSSFFSSQDGIKGCIKGAGGWFQAGQNKQGCDVQKDGTFKEFAKCAVPLFKGFFLDDFSSPSLYVSIGASGVLGIVGGGTTFDVNFGFDGSVLFSYTKCNTLSTPDLGGGISISIGMFGKKNDIPGESYVLSAGAGIPGTKIDANAEVVYSSDGERVIGMGANFGTGIGLDLAPISATCSNCDTKILGCVTTLDEMGLGYLMDM